MIVRDVTIIHGLDELSRLVLLNGLTALMGQHKQQVLDDSTPPYSPNLNFDTACFEESFWKGVASS